MKTRYAEEQNIRPIMEHEAAAKIDYRWRQSGITSGTIYHWRSRVAGLDAGGTTSLRKLEHPNSTLKKLLAKKSLGVDAMKDELSQKWFSLLLGRKLLNAIIEARQLSQLSVNFWPSGCTFSRRVARTAATVREGGMRQRDRILQQAMFFSAKETGVPCFYIAGKTDSERVRRKPQRQVPQGMLEREMVEIAVRGESRNQSTARSLQPCLPA